MNEKNDKLNEAFANIDSKYISAAQSAPKYYRGRKAARVAVAACLAVTLTAALIFSISVALIGGVRTEAELELSGHRVTAESFPDIEGNDLQEEPLLDPPMMTMMHTPYGFKYGIAVEAKVTEVLPDVYIDPHFDLNYRILKLEVLDVISGKNMPKEFYYRMPTLMSTELESFDSLIMNITQVGLEDCIMVNDTTKAAESFTLLFECSGYLLGLAPNYGTVLAFTNGWFDTSLWELDGWAVKFGDIESYLENMSPVKKGYHLFYAKYKIKKYYKDRRMDEKTVLTKSSFDFSEAAEAFEYIYSGENDSFAQAPMYSSQLSFIKIVDGALSNEKIYITEDSVSYLGQSFKNVASDDFPDLALIAESLHLDSKEGSHVDDLGAYKISYCYIKAKGEAYGVIGVQRDSITSYYLVLSDGTYIETTDSDELWEHIGVSGRLW